MGNSNSINKEILKLMEEKIIKLETSIVNTYVEDFKFKLDEVVSMGESPIEKLMILQLFNYFLKYDKKDKDDDSAKFANLDFIYEEICLFNYPDESEPKSEYHLKILEEKVTKFNYRPKNGRFYKFVGFKCTMNKNIYLNDKGLYFRDIEIRPQFYEINSDGHYRIDIAFILKTRNWEDNNKIIEERKIAIECDGYDYHSSPSQKREDDIRTRKLKRAGWKEIVRYSGSEIYHIDNDLNHMDYNFEEIMEIIMY